MGPHEGRVEGENCLCQPAGHASFDASQDKLALWAGCGISVMARHFHARQQGDSNGLSTVKAFEGREGVQDTSLQ